MALDNTKSNAPENMQAWVTRVEENLKEILDRLEVAESGK